MPFEIIKTHLGYQIYKADTGTFSPKIFKTRQSAFNQARNWYRYAMNARGSDIQAIIFKRKYFNHSKAKKWLMDHGFKSYIRVDVTKNYLRYRLIEPDDSLEYRIIPFDEKVSFVIEYY